MKGTKGFAGGCQFHGRPHVPGDVPQHLFPSPFRPQDGSDRAAYALGLPLDAHALGGSPVGMSMDPANRRLFVGCRKPQKLIVMSADDGKVLADLPIGAGVDATQFDGDIFASCRDGTLAVARETSPGKFAIVQTVTTKQGAKTMGLDPTTHTLYLPTNRGLRSRRAGAVGSRSPPRSPVRS